MSQLSGTVVEPRVISFTPASERKYKTAPGFFAALYSELHRMARRQLARYGGPITLGAATLLHQTYLSLAERSGPSFPDRSHFLAYVARAMRGLIVDHARRRRGLKRGGEVTLLNAEAPHTPVDDRELVLIRRRAG